MPYVKIELLKGRTREQKAAVADAVTQALVTLAASRAEDVHVVFTDVEKGDWSIAGKLLDQGKTS
jgi:4-oxalocrotonate tautomerase